MHASFAKKLAKKMKRQAGFTLLEILVVLTIMGFLIAMVAPRLAGISTGAVDTVCDSNQSRTIQMVAAYFEKTGKFPDKLTNLIIETAADTFTLPTVSDDNPDNGAEVLSSEFVQRVKPVIHFLNAAEADQLNEMGISRVFNLNDYSGTDTGNGSPMELVKVEEGIGVMMSGIGVPETTGDTFQIGTDTGTAATFGDIIGYGEAQFLGRIVMGLGPENGLITSGLVSNAAHCPGGIQNADNVTYNDYNIVLPRLDATAERLDASQLADGITGVEGIQYVAIGYTEDYDTTGAQTVTVDVNGTITSEIPANLKARVESFTEQPAYLYATMCPEGHMFPADDSDFWAIELDSNTAVSITINE